MKDYIEKHLKCFAQKGVFEQIKFKSSKDDDQFSIFDQQKKDIFQKIESKEEDEGSFGACISYLEDEYRYEIFFQGKYDAEFNEEEKLIFDSSFLPMKKVKVNVFYNDQYYNQFKFNNKGKNYLLGLVEEYIENNINI